MGSKVRREEERKPSHLKRGRGACCVCACVRVCVCARATTLVPQPDQLGSR